MADGPPKVHFDFIKSQLFRVIRADGAIGGLTPSGFIHIALYSERPAIPQRLVHEVNPDGTLGRELPNETVTRGGIVREMECDLFLTVEAAENLARWLDSVVEQARGQRAAGNGQGGAAQR